jgi:polysaccharide biosynthesis/export protein
MTVKFRSKNTARVLAGALALAALVPTSAGAQTGPRPGGNPAVGVTPPPAPAGVPATVLAAIPDYVIGAEDVLSIVFWRDKDMSTEVAVRPDGKITVPLLNDVHAAGLTPAQLKDLLVEESKKYVEDPNVSVVVKQINSRKVFITGEVNKPGPYPLMAPTTVLQLIVIAGGLREYAHSDNVSIMRTENGRPTSYRFNYKEFVKNKNLRQNIELKPGDTVIVP